MTKPVNYGMIIEEMRRGDGLPMSDLVSGSEIDKAYAAMRKLYQQTEESAPQNRVFAGECKAARTQKTSREALTV